MNIAKKAAVALTVAGIATGASAGSAVADAVADGDAVASPGVASGLVGLLNPAFGNTAVNK
ncbi:chaplin [Streptomyces sp. NPDC004270]